VKGGKTMEKKIKIVMVVVAIIALLIAGIMIYSSNQDAVDSDEISNQITDSLIEDEEVNIGTVEIPDDLSNDDLSNIASNDLLENDEEVEIGELI
jgi:uncharacterized membrane protein affecting hemolysin expression